MAREKKPVVQFRWQAEGQPDPFPNYLDRPREDLPMADFSDDELANYAFMNYDRSQNEEVAVMMAMGNDGHVPKIAFMTAVKERIRWLSRQLAIAQGTYPGCEKVPAPTQEEVTRILLKQPPMSVDELIDHERKTTLPPGSGFSLTGDKQLDAHVLRQYGDSPTAEAERRMMSHALGDLDALLESSKDAVNPETGKPYDVVVVGGGNDSIFGSGKTAREVLSQLEQIPRFVAPEVVLNEEERTHPHRFWHNELNELINKLGLNQIMFNPAQAQSRILRLAKDLDTSVIRDALGNAPSYLGRLMALRKVRKAFDEGVAASHARVTELFGEQAVQDAEELQQVPEHRLGPNENWYHTVVIKDPETPEKKDE